MCIHRFADYSDYVQKILYATVSIAAQNNGLVRIRARFPLPNNPVVSKTNTEIFLNCESVGQEHDSDVIEHDVTAPVLATFEQKPWFNPLADSLAEVLASPTNADIMGFMYELSDMCVQ